MQQSGGGEEGGWEMGRGPEDFRWFVNQNRGFLPRASFSFTDHGLRFAQGVGLASLGRLGRAPGAVGKNRDLRQERWTTGTAVPGAARDQGASKSPAKRKDEESRFDSSRHGTWANQSSAGVFLFIRALSWEWLRDIQKRGRKRNHGTCLPS